MKDTDLNLNTSAPLPDATMSSQSGGYGANAADFKRGFLAIADEKTPPYDCESDGGTTQVGDPMSFTGGVCGRPKGWAR